MEKFEGGLNAKFQKRKPGRRTSGGFVNDVLSSWDEMKIEHIRNAIDAQRGVVLEITEKQGVLLRFSVPTRHVKRERVMSLSLGSYSKVPHNCKSQNNGNNGKIPFSESNLNLSQEIFKEDDSSLSEEDSSLSEDASSSSDTISAHAMSY